jgi:5-methylcytosine-specific restriction protein A
MPLRPPQACRRCGRAFTGTVRCPFCERPYNRRAWRRLSDDFRLRFPFCGQRSDGAFCREHSVCARSGLRTLAEVVDHIVPLTEGGDLLDETNLQSLCLRCHRMKTVLETGDATW